MNETRENPKFRRLTQTAYGLFLRHGFRRVSIEEICAEADVSKMTFYKYFKNKKELIKYLLEKTFSEQMDEYRAIMAWPIAFPEKIKRVLGLKHDQTKLMSREFFNEIVRKPDPEIGELIQKFTRSSAAEVLESFKSARENGDIRADIKPEFILYFLNHISKMAEDELLTGIYDSPHSLTMELTNFFFYGILGPEAKGEA